MKFIAFLLLPIFAFAQDIVTCESNNPNDCIQKYSINKEVEVARYEYLNKKKENEKLIGEITGTKVKHTKGNKKNKKKVNVAPKPKLKVLGIWSNAALIKINGFNQTVKQGDSLNNGWVIKDIKDNYLKIKKNSRVLTYRL